MLKKITLTIVILLCTTIASAGDWEYNFMGINPNHFKGRDWKMILVGAASSLVVHEAGHLLYAKMNGGGSWNINTIHMDDYHNRTHGEQQMFHRAGFVAQIAVGGLLTAIPKTRHSDFAVGFNSFATLEMATYVTIGHGNDNTSDIKQLDHGTAEGIAYTIGSGALTYINLKIPIE